MGKCVWKDNSWCVYAWRGECWFGVEPSECEGVRLFPSFVEGEGNVEVLAERLNEREKREVREVYRLILERAVASGKDRLSLAEVESVKRCCKYWLGCWYFKPSVVVGRVESDKK